MKKGRKSDNNQHACATTSGKLGPLLAFALEVAEEEGTPCRQEGQGLSPKSL